MPITSPASYPPVMRAFLQHWAAVNDFLGSDSPLVLAGNREVAELSALHEALEEARDRVVAARVDCTLAREELNDCITALQGRLVEFNSRVRADFAGKPFARVLRDAFALGDGEGAVRGALRAMAHLWARMEALATPPPGVAWPLVLLGGYTRAAFAADCAALDAAYGVLSVAEVDLKLTRERRNDVQQAIRPLLSAYRRRVPTALPAGHPLLATLPVLSPVPGRRPKPVAATATWDAATSQARLTWKASAEPELLAYEVRGVPGESYEAEDEVVLAAVPPEGPRVLLTGFGLGAPGARAGYRVYVVLSSGRERGSAPVYVRHPG